MFRLLIIGLFLGLLIGCGNSKHSTIANENEKFLTLIDSPINGVEYSCGKGYGGLTGIGVNSTQGAGSFICAGQEIKFSLGSLVLAIIPEKSYKNNEKIYPQKFFERQKDLYKTKEVLNFAQFIQSIDDDGDISRTITISQEMRDKISELNIQTINWKENSEVLNVLKKLDKTPKNMESVTRHLLINTNVPYIEASTFMIKDNLQVGEKVGDLNITNNKNITKIEIIQPPSAREYFDIKNDGSIYLKKHVDYTKQLQYKLIIRAYRETYSNPASLIINVHSSTDTTMNTIKTPTILYPNNQNVLFTKQSNYSVKIKGRKATNIYWNNSKIGIMPDNGTIKLQREIHIKNTEQRYKIKLKYDNDLESPDATLRVVYDDTKPIIKTPTTILVAENSKLAKVIEVEDSSKRYGLHFTLAGGVDKNLLTIDSNSGLLAFKTTIDYDNKQDANKDNIYEVKVKVTDKSGNFESKNFKIRVENRESISTIANSEFTIIDSKEIGDYIGQIKIKKDDSTITSIELFENDKEYFSVTKEGKVYLKKKVLYQKKHIFFFMIQATNNRNNKSNIATVKVVVKSQNNSLEEPIKAPTITYHHQLSKIYTKTDTYGFSLKGRANTNIYLDNEKIGVMKTTGDFWFTNTIKGKDREERHELYLKYDNGVYGKTTKFVVIKDTEAPLFLTSTQIVVPENTKLAKAINIQDRLKSHGLDFKLNGGVDKNLFAISATTGLLEFKNNVDYENKQDANQDNIYEVIVKVTDKAENFANKLFKVKIENRESIPLIENSEFTIYDNKKVNEYIGQINIDSNDSIITSIELFNNDKEYFNVTKEGKVYLKKEVLYQTKNHFLFKAQVTNNRNKKSNIATITIHIKSKDSSLEKPIKAPTITYKNALSKIYTKTDTYGFELKGRANTNIYLDNEKIGVMNTTGNFVVTNTIKGKDREERHELYLKYDNGVYGKTTKVVVIKDTHAPNITTPKVLEKEENIRLITNISAEDINKKDGLTFILENIKDTQHFNLLENGELSFKELPDFENPLDKNRDNSYELSIKVIDKAENSSTINLTIKIIDILDSKPTIEPFTKEIPNSLVVGTKVGKVKISKGDSELTALYLEGEGKEYFDIHSNGEIILIQSVKNKTEFHLNLIAKNEFGEDRQPIFIKIINDVKAIAKLDTPLSNAEIKIIRINQDNSQEVIDQNKTDSQGNFRLKPHLLDDNLFYIYEVKGGKNNALLRMIAKGSWIKKTSNIIVSPLSEMLYDYVVHYVKREPSQLENKLHASAKALLEKDLSGDYIIDAKDIMIFNSANHYNSLHTALKYNNSYYNIVAKMKIGDSEYIKTLFNAKVVKSFVEVEDEKKSGIITYKGELKFSGSIAYYHLGDTFYTYDMYNNKILGRLKLEAQDLTGVDPLRALLSADNAFNIQIYLDLKENRAYVVNLNEKVFIIDISNLKNPKFLGSFFRDWGNFIAFSSNNHLYMYSNEAWIGAFRIYDATSPTNVTPLGQEIVKEFNSITDTKLYSFTHTGCSTTDKLKITSRKITDVVNNIDKETIYLIPSINCMEEAYFDNNYMYIFTEKSDSFKIYKLIEESSEAMLVDELSLKIGTIFNINNNTIYAYGKDNIYFIDIADSSNLKIKKIIPYKYKYNSVGIFNDSNNLNITIRDNFIIESSRLIDLKIHELSAIYTEIEGGIDMSLFEKY